MSKFLVTENELRNALFKTFLKKPHLLKEDPNPPPIVTQPQNQNQKKDDPNEIADELATIIKGSAIKQMGAERKKGLVLLTLRRKYTDSNYFFKLDPGASVFDAFISGSYQKDNDWANANDVIDGDYEQWLQRTMELTQISTGIAPMVSIRAVKTRAFYTIDAVVNVFSMLNNVFFARELSKEKEAVENALANGSKYKIATGSKDGNGNDIEIEINPDDIGNEAYWYYTYAVCDALSLIPYLGFLIDAGINSTRQKGILENLPANRNVEGELYTYNDELDAFTPKNYNTAEKQIEDIDQAGNTYTASNQAKNRAPFTSHQEGYQMRTAIDKTMQDMAEATARGTTIVNKNDSAYATMKNKYLQYFYEIINGKILDFLNNNDKIAVKLLMNVLFKNGDDKTELLKILIQKNSDIVKSIFRKLLKINESVVLDLDTTTGLPTIINNYKDLQKSKLLQDFFNLAIEDNTLKVNELVLNKFKSLTNTMQNEFCMQFYNTIINSKNYKNTDIYNEFAQLKLTIKLPNINNKLDKIINDVIDNVDNVDLERNPILEILLSNNIKKINIEDINSIEDLRTFIQQCVEFTGVTEKKIIESIQDYIQASVSKISSGMEKNIILNNMDDLFELIKISQRENAVTGPLHRALQGSLNKLYEISLNKAIPKNISSVNEIFPKPLQNEYVKKLNKIRGFILNSIDSIENITVKLNIETELKKMPFDTMALKSIKDILSKNNIEISKIDKILNLYEKNLNEVLEYIIDCHYFKNKNIGSTDLPKLDITNDFKEFAIFFPSGEISFSINSLIVYKKLYESLKASNKFQKYFYNKKLTRFFKAMNSQKTSAFDVLNNITSDAQGSLYTAVHKDFNTKVGQLGIPKIIDGSLQITEKNVANVATNMRQFHVYMMRLLKRYVYTFELISNPKKVTQEEYIQELINHKIIEQADGENLLEFAVTEKKANFTHEKYANEGMPMTPVAKTTAGKLQQKLLNFFVDEEQVYAKLPNLIQHKIISKIADISDELKINGLDIKNLAQEIKNVNKIMPKCIEAIDEEIIIIQTRKQELRTLPKPDEVARRNIELEDAICDFKIEFLQNLRKEMTNFINETREKSVVGVQGYRIIDEEKLLGTMKDTEGKSIQSKSGIDKLLEIATLPRLDHDRLNLLDKIYKFFKYLQTGFTDRGVRNIVNKIIANKNITVDNGETAQVSESIWSFFRGLGDRIFNKGTLKAELPDRKLLSFSNLNWISSVASATHATFLIMLVGNVGFLTATAIFIKEFFSTFVLGVFSKMITKMLFSKIQSLQNLAVGMLTEIIAVSSKISKQIARYMHSLEDEYRRLTFNDFMKDDVYMSRVKNIAFIEDDSQHTFFGKNLTRHVTDFFLDDAEKEKILVKGAKNIANDNSRDLFGLLNKLYDSYGTLKKFCLDNEDFKNSALRDTDSLMQKIFRNFDLIFNPNQNFDTTTGKNKNFVDNFKIAMIYILFMNEFDNTGGGLDSIVRGKMETELYDLLADMYVLRRNLKMILKVVGEDLQLLDTSGFNPDSLITGGWYNVKLTELNFKYSFANQYAYKVEIEGAEKTKKTNEEQQDNADANKTADANAPVTYKNIPHFQKETIINQGTESEEKANNLALEIYSFYKASNTHGLEVISIPHSYLFKPIRDIYYSIQLSINQLEDMRDGTSTR